MPQPLQVVRFTYEYGERVLETTLVVTGEEDGNPIGHQVWSSTEPNTWVVDDEPTMVANPITDTEVLGIVRLLVTRHE